MAQNISLWYLQAQTAKENSVFFNLLILNIIFDCRALRVIQSPLVVLKIKNLNIYEIIEICPSILLEQD